MQQLADDLWVLRYPLTILGAQFGRTTTVIRIGRELLIHSTAPFSAEDIAKLWKFGTPTWLVEATTYHDTYVAEALSTLPGIAYYAPEVMSAVAASPTQPLSSPPAAWQGQVDVLALQGLSSGHEHVFFHRASHTLVVADVFFNPSPEAPLRTRLIFRALSGLKPEPGMSKLFEGIIKDRAAFTESIMQMLAWDFDRIIVAHGNIIESSGKAVARAILEKKKFAV